MSDDAGLAAWLRLTLTAGVGGETQRTLLKTFGLPEQIFASSLNALRSAVGAPIAERLLHDEPGVAEAIDAALAWAQQPDNHLLTLADSAYPQALLRCPDPPVLLYVKGRAELLNRPALAIVGSRNATPQGQADADAFAAALCSAGLTIVSGLALGIDTAAHRGALGALGRDFADRQAGSTIAVIGTGADRVYPARNRDLARLIAEHGAIVSEFPLDTPPLSGNFPRRNRIIAGLSQGCLVVEAAARSGSLITARLAAEAGSEVFAIPGSIHSALAKGCHHLIRQGAKLVETAQDVLEELRWPATAAVGNARNETAANDAEPQAAADPLTARVLLALGHDPCDVDSLVERTGLTAETLLAMLLQLELDGHVASLPGSRYQRIC